MVNAQPSDSVAQPDPVAPQPVLRIEAGKKIDTARPFTPAELRKSLASKVHKSKDKLFLIRRSRPGHSLASWHLVQVDDKETNWRKAKDEGMYHVRYFVRSLADS